MLGMDDAIVLMAMNYAAKKQSNIRRMRIKTRQVITLSINLNGFSDKNCLRDFRFKRTHTGIMSERCKLDV